LKRIIVFADTHLFRDADNNRKKEEEMQGQLPIGEILFMRLFKVFFEKQEFLARGCFNKMVAMISELELGPFNYLLDLGDATYGSYNQGLVTEEAIQERLAYNQLIKDNFSDRGLKKKFLWGNHDTGFQDKLTKIFNLGYWSKGMSKESFLKAEELIGPPWGAFEAEGFTFLLLNSEIIRASTLIESIGQRERPFFLRKKKEQEEFIKNTLKKRQENRIILTIHDPRQLKVIWPIIKPYHRNVCLTLAGHFHLNFSGRVFRKFHMYRKLNLEVIPSLWPFGGSVAQKIFEESGGFAVLEISDGSFNLESHWF